MPTLDELRIRHRWSHQSTAHMVSIPDDITDGERSALRIEQEQWEYLRAQGQREGWLKITVGNCGQRGNWFVLRGTLHPSRTVTRTESDEEYRARQAALRSRLDSTVKRGLTQCQQLRERLAKVSGQNVPFDAISAGSHLRTQAIIHMGFEKASVRKSERVRDELTPTEAAMSNAGASLWTAITERGLSEGWLIVHSGRTQPHDLLLHPSRTRTVLETDAVWKARRDGLDAYIRARVTQPS